MMEKNKKIIIAGGGTGGHVFPAIAIAKAIIKIMPSADILFVGAIGKMEMDKVPLAGFKIVGLPIAGFQRKNLIKNINLPFKILRSFFKARRLVKNFKPDVVVGVGGYASAPIVFVSNLFKVPVLLQEQNAMPGLTNRLLAKKANKICVAYNEMDNFFPKEKIILTGNPVRPEIKKLNVDRDIALRFFNLEADKKTVLVIGGSLGAYSINTALLKSLLKFDAQKVQFIWQTGISFSEQAMQYVEEKNITNCKVFKFIEKMDYAYTVADVIVSRSGAISISELCLVKKPVILVPSPNVTDDHQKKNALALATKNAALMIEDENLENSLYEVVSGLVNDELKQLQLKTEIAKIGTENADEDIAKEVINLLNKY